MKELTKHILKELTEMLGLKDFQTPVIDYNVIVANNMLCNDVIESIDIFGIKLIKDKNCPKDMCYLVNANYVKFNGVKIFKQ